MQFLMLQTEHQYVTFTFAGFLEIDNDLAFAVSVKKHRIVSIIMNTSLLPLVF